LTTLDEVVTNINLTKDSEFQAAVNTLAVAVVELPRNRGTFVRCVSIFIFPKHQTAPKLGWCRNLTNHHIALAGKNG